MSIGIACLGAGIFARNEHIPAIQDAPELSLKAIYSRSQQSAQALSENAGIGVDIYHASPVESGKSLDDLLARSDIHAVVVALPILAQPEIIRKALTAGKHVLSEKPIAKDVQIARGLLEFHESLATKPLWGVAENFRFMEPFVYARDTLKDIGGELRWFSTKLQTMIADDNKYYKTSWRQVPEYQGGFLLDGGVHFIAGLRFLLQGAGDEVASLTASSRLIQEKLAPVDTVDARLTTRKGAVGNLNLSFGMELGAGFDGVEVITSQGRIKANPDEVFKFTRGSDGKVKEDKISFTYSSGVKAEVAAFAQGIASGQLDSRQTPTEALKDLQLLQALLESAEHGGSVQEA